MSAAEIDLWWFRMPKGWPEAPGAESAAHSLLDEAELERFHSFANPTIARFFAYRRAARRLVLAEVTGARPDRLTFETATGGKPRFAGDTTSPEFSATDSETTGALAVRASGPVGIDLELDRTIDANRLAERVLSPAERAAYLETPANRKAAWILRAWTAKEALVKAMGTGLDLAGFRQITVPQAPRLEDWRPVQFGRRMARRGSWQICFRSLPGEALTAIAAPEAVEIRVIDAAPLLARHGFG